MPYDLQLKLTLAKSLIAKVEDRHQKSLNDNQRVQLLVDKTIWSSTSIDEVVRLLSTAKV